MGTERGNKETIEYIYEGFMVMLAFSAVATIWYQTQYDTWIVWGTWGIFFTDFLIRFVNADNKMYFIRKNPFIVIAAVPLDAIFQIARIARILHFMRLKVITKYYTKPVIKKIRQQRFVYIIPAIFAILFAAVIPLYFAEPKLTSYYDAFLGGLASLVFFGYSAINPETAMGTALITLLTIFGVILHGVFLSFIFDLVSSHKLFRKWKRKLERKRGHAS